MATTKLLRYPKKPKQTASIETKQRYLARVKEVDRENAKRKAEKKKSAELSKKIAAVGKCR